MRAAGGAPSAVKFLDDVDRFAVEVRTQHATACPFHVAVNMMVFPPPCWPSSHRWAARETWTATCAGELRLRAWRGP